MFYVTGTPDNIKDDEGLNDRLSQAWLTTLLESPGLLEYQMDVRDYE